MDKNRLSGLGVALVTPFKTDHSIDYEALAKIINHVISGGCDYIVALGTTAETPTLTKEEKIILTDFIREETAGRVPLVIGIGGNNTKAVCDDIASRDLSGYSAILSVAPYYNKPSQEGIFQHYKAISETSPLHIILYNIPGRAGVNITAKTTLRLAEFSSKFIGVKEASGNIEQCEEIIKNSPKDFFLISGDDSTTYSLMKIGAKGVISVLANAYPKYVRRLVSLCEGKSWELAEDLQNLTNPLIRHLFEEGNPAGVKDALSKLGLIENVLRLPLLPVSCCLSEKISKAVDNISIIIDD